MLTAEIWLSLPGKWNRLAGWQGRALSRIVVRRPVFYAKANLAGWRARAHSLCFVAVIGCTDFLGPDKLALTFRNDGIFVYSGTHAFLPR